MKNSKKRFAFVFSYSFSFFSLHMNTSWIRGMSLLPSINDSNIDKPTNNHINSEINNTSSGCPSHIHFGDTSYTLGFGHLFSGNLHNYQSFNPIRQCYELCTSELPECCSNPFNSTYQQEPVINHKVNEAMELIRKTTKNVDKQHEYSIPSEFHSMNRAAEILERAANAMSIAGNTQKQFR
jgi:hypothetical protein